MLYKIISVIWFPWWGWTERLDLSRILLMLKRGAFIGLASIPFASRICIMDRADQPLLSSITLLDALPPAI